MGTLHPVATPLVIASDKENACAAFGALEGAICQNMLRSGATTRPNSYYRLQHLWAEKWKAANPRARDFLAVDPAAETTPEGANDVKGINKLAATMLGKFRIICEKACGATVYMALSHGGAKLLERDQNKLPARQAKLQEDRQAYNKYKSETDSLGRKHADYASRREYEAKERKRLDCEEARVNRQHFPTFSLGSQKGGLHAQYLAMSYEYFVYLDHPEGGWNDAERACFDARKAYFAALKTIFQQNQIKTLHLVACEIGKDSGFIQRVGQELGVGIVSYAYFTLVREVTGFMGLSSDEIKDDIAPATSVDPPRSPVVVS
jgi:hypothetical protein